MVLKLDGRTLRGRKWKELNASGSPLKQGALLGKKLCTKCNATPDLEREAIECMSCHLHFHLPCLLEPVSESFIETVSTNPSVYWFCLGCISCKSSNESAPIGNLNDDISDKGMPADVVLTSTLLNFKKDILTLVGETMDTKFKNFAGLIDKYKNPESNEKSKKDVSEQSYADAVVNSVVQVVDQTSINPPKGQERSASTERHVLLLEPTELENDCLESTTAKKPSLSLINNAMAGVNVDFCSVKKSGCVAIGFQSADSLKAAEKKLKENKDCSLAFSTRLPKKMMPKVTVHGISEVLFEGCENREQMCNVLLDDIIKRNANVKSVIDGAPTEFITVVMVHKKINTNDHVTYTAVLKMSSAVRKAIFNNDNKLYVSLKRCKVTDRYHVKQCYHCQKPGHVSNDCPVKNDDALPTCFYCSGPHSSATCTNKRSENNQRCANCLKSKNPEMVKGANSHTAASRSCPIMQSYVNNIKRKTVNWKEKNIL